MGLCVAQWEAGLAMARTSLSGVRASAVQLLSGSCTNRRAGLQPVPLAGKVPGGRVAK
jgi:hypothetical protein